MKKFLCAWIFVICAMIFGTADARSLTYEVHVAGYGWQSRVSEGDVAGTTGESRAIEAIVIDCSGIQYQFMLQKMAGRDGEVPEMLLERLDKVKRLRQFESI